MRTFCPKFADLLTNICSYTDKIGKAYQYLENLRQKSGPNAQLITEYLEATREPMQKISQSVYSMTELDATVDAKMKKLRLERQNDVENSIKKRLKDLNYKIEYNSLSAICGSDRIEAVRVRILLNNSY